MIDTYRHKGMRRNLVRELEEKGISSEEASKIIGKHFPEVNDKLINIA